MVWLLCGTILATAVLGTDTDAGTDTPAATAADKQDQGGGWWDGGYKIIGWSVETGD